MTKSSQRNNNFDFCVLLSLVNLLKYEICNKIWGFTKKSSCHGKVVYKCIEID